MNADKHSLMNRILLSTSMIALISIGLNVDTFAQTDFAGKLTGVSVTDSAGFNIPPVANFNFITNDDIVTFDASSSIDSDGTIIEYRWNFGDGTSQTGQEVTHQFSPGQFQVTLAVVDNNYGATLLQRLYSNIFEVHVNFQPPTTPVPEGFISDSGETFNQSTGKGWLVMPWSTRERNNSASPGKEYDTFATAPSNGVWEIEVPKNGSYSITVCTGDVSTKAGTQNVQAEGVSIIDNVKLSPTTIWAVNSKVIDVSDGKITLTFIGSTTTYICWVKIVSQ